MKLETVLMSRQRRKERKRPHSETRQWEYCASGTGNLVKEKESWRKHSAAKLCLCRGFVFQRDKDLERVTPDVARPPEELLAGTNTRLQGELKTVSCRGALVIRDCAVKRQKCKFYKIPRDLTDVGCVYFIIY